jgi:hypothetical protein
LIVGPTNQTKLLQGPIKLSLPVTFKYLISLLQTFQIEKKYAIVWPKKCKRYFEESFSLVKLLKKLSRDYMELLKRLSGT